MNAPVTDAVEAFVDLQFSVQGGAIPVDYADALWVAVREVLPWLEADALAGIHPLSGLSPGVEADEWYLSRRSRLTLRLARDRAAAAQALVGTRLQLAGSAIEIGAPHLREFMCAPVLHAKFVAIGKPGDVAMEEDAFHAACVKELAALGVAPRIIFGRSQCASTLDGVLTGFSVLLHELTAENALLLQRCGLGGERKRGCGIFVPHKSFVAMGTLE